jgi:glucose/arabinose dehydrogenase
VVPEAKPQGGLPTLKMPTAQGWSDGQKPVAASGLKVNAFATGLRHPRWIHVLPDGGVLVAEAQQVPEPVRSVFDYAMQATMRRADALGESANRITLLRDADGDGSAEKRETFLEGLNQPFGMALVGDTFYVGGCGAHHSIRAETRHLQARRTLDPKPAREPPRQEALCRGRLAQQYRRQRHGGGRRARCDLPA